MKDDLLSIQEAAELYEIHPKTLYKRLRAASETWPDLLVSFGERRAGRKLYVRKSVLRRLLHGDG